MRGWDLIAYLWGSREAIERIAASRVAIVIGALLVLTAGIARNYDHLDLLTQREWFIGPFAASLFSTCFIFLWVWAALRLFRHGQGRSQLLTFLVLFWLTAPCAWLYGLPIEQWSGDMLVATKWNVAFLAVVSLWRVALIVRAVSVLTEAKWWVVLPAVLTPAAIEALVGSFFKSISLVGIMGGVRLSPSHEFLKGAQEFTMRTSLVVAVFSLVALVVVARKRSAPRSLARAFTQRTSVSAWGAVFVSLAGWIWWSSFYQPQVKNLHQLDRLLDEAKYREAINFASSKGKKGFPVTHMLPPDPYRWQVEIELLDAVKEEAPQWLRDEWMGNAIISYRHQFPEAKRVDWRALGERHPQIIDAMKAQAEVLRTQERMNSMDARWLYYFENAVEPALESPQPAATQ